MSKLLSEYILFDLETTGVRPYSDRVIEVGMIRVKDLEIVDIYNTLVNPVQPLPSFISDLTGISQEDVSLAPTFDSVFKDVSDYIGNTPLIAHNASFDISFLSAEFARLNEELTNNYFCSLQLSRRAFPQHRRHGIDALIERFGLEIDNRHRAMDDTTIILELLKNAHSEADTKLVDQIFSEPKRPKPKKRALTSPKRKRKTTTRRIKSPYPYGPGVYLFYSKDNTPLYIGKSINIATRINSHLRSNAPFIKSYSRIETKETVGELGALIRESILIKDVYPFYNKMLRHARSFITTYVSENEAGYKTLRSKEIPELSDIDVNEFFGIFRTRREMKTTLEKTAKEHGLCYSLVEMDSNTPCFLHQLGICNGACLGKEDPLAYNKRFESALKKIRISPWPFDGPILIKESNETDSETFLVDRWCVLGSDKDMIINTKKEPNYRFDPDLYYILRKFIRKPQDTIEITPALEIPSHINYC